MSTLSDNQDKGYLAAFEQLGIDDWIDSSDEKNYRGTCPFTDKEGKLYVNKINGLWDSKTAGVGGNFAKFCELFYDWAKDNTPKSEMLELSEHRKLPVEAFDDIAINPLNGEALIPQRNEEGKIISLGRYNGRAVYRTACTKNCLNYAHEIKQGGLVFICEGEWDTYALRFVLKTARIDATVVTVPGAGVLKDEWIHLFKGCDVVACYDNDKPGREGEKKVFKKLKGVAKSLRFVDWGNDESLKDGYDVRDHIISIFPARINEKTMRVVYSDLEEMFSEKPNYFYYEEGASLPQQNGVNIIPHGTEDGSQDRPLLGLDLEPPTYEELYEVFDENLKMISYIPVDIIMGTCFANRIEGDPIWTMLVAPPGGSKTEFLMTLNGSEWIETTTSLTPASLISGIKFPDGEDPSILIKINNRMLVIKDFTTILSMQPNVRDEIFGILRDAYDGYVEKFFGTGIKKSYHSKFGMLAGVTPAIDALAAQHASLGERFLKFRMSRFETEETEEEKILAAMQSVGTETVRRTELQKYVAACLRKPIPSALPKISQENYLKLVKMARLTAMLRGAVSKDNYSGEMLCMPIVEVGTRLSKQLSKLAMGIAVFKDKDEVDEEIMKTIRLVCFDTCPDRFAKVVEVMYKETQHDFENAFVKPKDIIRKAHITDTTFSRMSENMTMLNILEKHKGSMTSDVKWCLSKKVFQLSKDAGLFD